jgi:predicted nicotinamide N-methyase
MLFAALLKKIRLGKDEIQLLVPEPEAIKSAYQEGYISFPYWSRVWPAAKALAQFIILNPAYTEAKRVVELGAGLGLPSLIAARNAMRVLCTDYVPEAVAIAEQSAAHLHLQNFRAEVMDWRHLPQDLEADVLLLSDINYDPVAFSALQAVVAAFLQKETTVLLSTPQRLMAKEFIAPLLVDCTHQEEIGIRDKAKVVMTSVLVLKRGK